MGSPTLSHPILATQVSMRNLEALDSACRSSLGCGGLDLTTVSLLAVTAVLALLVFAAVVHVWDAERLLDDELQRLAAERDAFAKFSRRIAAMEVAESTTMLPAAGGLVATTDGRDNQLARIRDAYRETVMAVDHYEEDYGESLPESLAAEFGENVAVAVTDGDQFSPQLQTALVSKSREARQERASFISMLETEAEALDKAASTLKTLNADRASLAEAPLPIRSYETLVDDWHRLGELLDRCEALVHDRQRQLKELNESLPPGTGKLHEYLYDDLSVTHPVLADASIISERIDELRHEVLHSISRRV